MKIEKLDILVFVLAALSGMVGCFVIGGLLAVLIQRITVGPQTPDVFGWFGLSVVMGASLALMCVPANLILAGFKAAQRAKPVQVLPLFPIGGLMSTVALLIWFTMGPTPTMALLASGTCALCAVIIGVINRRRLQNQSLEQTCCPAGQRR